MGLAKGSSSPRTKMKNTNGHSPKRQAQTTGSSQGQQNLYWTSSQAVRRGSSATQLEQDRLPFVALQLPLVASRSRLSRNREKSARSERPVSSSSTWRSNLSWPSRASDRPLSRRSIQSVSNFSDDVGRRRCTRRFGALMDDSTGADSGRFSARTPSNINVCYYSQYSMSSTNNLIYLCLNINANLTHSFT